MPMMTLGLFVFDLPTAAYQRLSRQSSWRHSEHNRIGRRPGYQYLGPGSDKITLTGSLYPELTGGRISLDLLRNMADTGKGWPMIEGSGRMYGNWAVTAVDETDTVFMRDGVPRKIEFSMDLVRVDEENPGLLATGVNAALTGATGALAGPLNQVRDRLPVPGL